MSLSVPRTATLAVACTLFLAVDRPLTLNAQGPNTRGNPSQIVTETDFDLDNIPDAVTTRTFTYQGGDAVQVVTVFDGNTVIDADGIPDQIQTQSSTFDAHHNPIQDVVLIDLGGNGTIEQQRIDDYTYDAHGNLLLRDDKVYNYITSVQLNHNTFESTWDNHDNLLTQVIENDFNNDGVIDRRQSLENEYDSKGNVIENTIEVDTDGNGVVDTRRVTTIQRDNNGRPTLQTLSIDDPADGTIDETRTSHSFVFQGSTIQQVSTDRDTAPLGAPPDWTSLTTFTYDQGGLLVAQSIAYDLGANGSVDFTLVNTASYNNKKNLTETVNQVDIDGDGSVDQRVRTIYTY
jgi:hypothetical protein